jgi:hypothetical protein
LTITPVVPKLPVIANLDRKFHPKPPYGVICAAGRDCYGYP